MRRTAILMFVGAGMMSVILPVGADDEAVGASENARSAQVDEEQTVNGANPSATDAAAEDVKSDSPPDGSGGDPEHPENADDPEDSIDEEQFLQDPFTYLQSDMQSAVVDLKDGQTKPPAKVTQPRILERFDLLIARLEEQSGGAGAAGQRATRPAQQSSLMRGPGGQNEMRAPRVDGRDWADLSPKERQKILQSKTDGFPAGYDEVLADYFRRVARAQEAATSAGADSDSTTDTSDEGSN